jgi:hypothetical protein
VFRFSTENTSIEVEGPEEFLLPHLDFLAPFVRRSTGAAPPPAASAPGAAAAPAAGIEGVADWWYRSVPEGNPPSVMDPILLLAFYMRTYRKTVFLSEDIRRCFQVMNRAGGMEEPRSLLQILGNIKREHGLLLNAGKRGEYMMNTTGIARAREILARRPAAAPAANGATGPAGQPGPGGKPPDARSIFKD